MCSFFWRNRKMATMLARTPMDATMKSRTPSTMNSKESLNIIFTEKNLGNSVIKKASSFIYQISPENQSSHISLLNF